MECRGVRFSQSVNLEEVTYDNVLCYENIIENISNETITDIFFDNVSSIEFNNVYYDTYKNRKDIKIEENNNLLKIDSLRPGDKVKIFINIVIDKAFTSKILKSYGSLSFINNDNERINIKTNESIVNFVGIDFKDEGKFEVNIDKKIISVNEELKVDIEIENRGNKKAFKVELGDLIPFGTAYIENSLYINNSLVKLNNDLENIRLGNIDIFKKISISFSLKLLDSYSEEILYIRPSLKYEDENLSKQDFIRLIRAESKNMKIRRVSIENFKKIVSKNILTVGEKVDFKIKAKNTGNINIFDLFIKEKELDCLKFIPGTLKINGREVFDKTPFKGVNIDIIRAGESFCLEYSAIAIDVMNDIKNGAILNYKYSGFSNKKIEVSDILSSCESFSIKSVILKTSEKKSNKKSVFLGDDIDYSISIENTGNLIAENILWDENIPNFLKIKEGSLVIRGKKILNDNLTNISLGNINPGSKIDISYKATVIDFPTYENNENQSNIRYKYNLENIEKEDNYLISTEPLVVKGAIIKKDSIQKILDKNYISVGEEVDVKISFKNEGNLKAEKIFIKEEIKECLSFVKGSLKVNGDKKHYDIEEGFLLGDLDIEEFAVISFKLRANMIPYIESLIINTNITYSHVGDLLENRVKKNINIESDEIYIKSAIIDSNLGVFKRETSTAVAKVDNKVNIRMLLRNTGNRDAFNVILNENLASSMLIQENSLIVNGKEQLFDNRVINIGNLKVGEEREIIYDVIVSKDSENQLSSFSEVEYFYYPYEGSKLVKAVGKSNILNLNIYNSDLLITESINKVSAEIGEELNYNLYLTNKGNIKLDDISLNFDIDSYCDLEISEFSINRQFKEKVSFNSYIYIGDIDINESKLISMKFKINNLNSKNKLNLKANICASYLCDTNKKELVYYRSEGKEIQLNLSRLNIVKKTSKKRYLKGERVEYLITVRNDGTGIVENIIIEDEAMKYGFIEDSLTVNGYFIEKTFLSGIPIEKIKQGECIFIRYAAIYDINFNNKEVSGAVIATGDFLYDNYGYTRASFRSENYTIYLEDVGVNIVKSATKKLITYGDRVKFISTIENKGTIELENLFVKEKSSKGFEVLDGNIFVNGTKVIKGNINYGIKIPNIKPKEVYEICTEYKYSDYKTIPRLETETILEYSYKSLDENKVINASEKSNKLILDREISTFKNISVDHIINLCANDIEVSEVTNTLVLAVINKTYVIKTINNKSYDNNRLIGYKLMVRGYLEENIEYIADNVDESIHVYSHKENFSTNIILPENFDINDSIRVRAKVNDVFSKVINNKTILNTINLTIEGLI